MYGIDKKILEEHAPGLLAVRNAAEETTDELWEGMQAIEKAAIADGERERQERIQQLTHEDQWECEAPAAPGDDVESSGSPGGLPSRRLTDLGTPVSPRWSEYWIELVNETEARLERRCCGAHAPDDLPCELESTHESGRCRFHGGAPNSGAQNGNANARLHGLYSKRLQRCGNHCTKWKTCPHGGDDVDALPLEKRPYCPYEVEELDALRELDRSAHERFVPLEERNVNELRGKPYPVYAQLFMQRENLNMLQVMISRALRVLGAQGFETETLRQTDNRFESVPKVSPAFQAYTLLMREFRLATRVYNRTIEQFGMPKYESP